MPFALVVKERVQATARACRAVVAARVLEPGSEWRALRALQLANFTSGLLLDDDAALGPILSAAGLDGAGIVARLDDPEVTAAYERDRAEARTAEGSPTEAQGKAAATDGPVRYTAPSLILERDGRRLEAGGWQTVEVYDALIANLDPRLPRRPAPHDPEPLLRAFPEGLVTQEVAHLMASGNDAPDRAGAERALFMLAARGRAVRTPLGGDAVWRAA
jgi:predicted DsbA family dithiol-disulfide isomerase